MKVYSKIGKVYLVGAGPGDPDLITLKAARCLEEAEVIIYDRLVDPRVLDLACESAERILVGKKGGHYTFPQEEINRLLVSHARKGLRVVRLKGGDPFVFGRGGEEAMHLAQNEIPFEIIPGVSSALAVPAAAGIPVTHRGVASSVAFITGHPAEGPESSEHWKRLSRSADTLVVLMPLKNLRWIVSQLILHGWALDTPAALVESGTLESQRQVTAPLGKMVAESATAGISSPALLIVGEVVKLSAVLRGSYQPPKTQPAASQSKVKRTSEL